MKKNRIGRRAALLVLLCLIAAVLAGCGKKEPGEGGESMTTSRQEGSIAATTGEEQGSTRDNMESTTARTPEETSSQEETESTEPVSTEPVTEADTTQAVETENGTSETESTTQVLEPVAEKPWDLLNNEPLNPTKSGYEELDNLIEGYLAMLKDEGVLTEDMSQYQTVHSIYVWFIKKIVYNRGMNVDAGKYSSSDPETTPEEVLWATDLLNTYQGCCYNYSSAFMYIMRALGYDAHLLSGSVGKYGGGTTPHCWLYVNLGGVAYTFDPDIDMNYYWRNIDSGEEVTDTLFCRKMDTMTSFYTIEKYHTN